MNCKSTPLPRKALKAPMCYKLRPRRSSQKETPSLFVESNVTTTSASTFESSLPFVETPDYSHALMPMLDSSIPTTRYSPERLPVAIRPKALSVDELSKLGLSFDDITSDDGMEDDGFSSNNGYLTPKAIRSCAISPSAMHPLVSPSLSFYELSLDQVHKLLLPDDF
jgi:hypothetical protein